MCVLIALDLVDLLILCRKITQSMYILCSHGGSSRWCGIQFIFATEVKGGAYSVTLQNHFPETQQLFRGSSRWWAELKTGIWARWWYLRCKGHSFSPERARTRVVYHLRWSRKSIHTVNRELLWKLLARYGIPDGLIMVFKKLYANLKVHLKVDGAS